MERSKKRNVRRKAVNPLEVRARTAGAIDGALKAVVITLGCGKQLHELVRDNNFITAENVEPFMLLVAQNLVEAFEQDIKFLARRRKKNGSLDTQYIDVAPDSTLRAACLNRTLLALRFGENYKGKLTQEKWRKDEPPELFLDVKWNLNHKKNALLKKKMIRATRQNGEEDDKPE